MKNFKLKINFLSSLLKKIKLTKKISNIFHNLKYRLKISNIKKKLIVLFDKFNFKRFKIRYLIFSFSLLFFYYLIYLSFPGILHNKSDQNYLTKLLRQQYGLEFSLTPEINYSILPKPHFQINNVVIFNKNNNFQKEIAQIKKMKLYLVQTNFLKKRQLKIKSVELFDTNFFISKSDITFVKKFLKNGFTEKSMIIKKANLFFQDVDKVTISFLNLKKVHMQYNSRNNNDVLTSEGEIFNIPFNVTWKQDLKKLEKNTNLKFKKINLNIFNSSRIINEKSINKLQVYLNRSKYIINYNLSSDKINFNSNNSFIGNDKLTYSGNIFLDPFNFDINSSLDSLKLKKLFFDSSFLKEILSSDFILNENFNGKINLNVKKLENNPFFDNLKININFKGRTLEFNNSIFLNRKIANLIVKKGILYEDKNNIIFKSNVDFVINDLDKFFNKFVVPKKNRHDLKKISFEILTNLTTNDLKILNITNESFKNKEFPEIDELIYEFNSGSVKVSNWIEFKLFANKIISYYAG
tara:strand:- start:1233 stop:2801 length:1569 start_codon:yes stop_codon:yes gene_type:complete